MPRDEVVAYFDQYVSRFRLPVSYNTRVTSVEPDSARYLIRTDSGSLSADNVVMATGAFQQPKIPDYSANLPAEVQQLHSSAYRYPEALPPGAVLIVGSAQSGCQIAEELYQQGRKVYLCVGSAPRAPRRYRGKDATWWLIQMGFFDQTVEQLPSLGAKYMAPPHLSGRDGGHTLNLHQFARDGVVLLGRMRGAEDGKVRLAPDLKDSLAKVDQFEMRLLNRIDTYVQQRGIQVPEEKLPQLQDGYQSDVITELDLKASGITSVIWASGYTFNYDLVKLPVFDADGFPVQQSGVTAYPGLYFVGLPWQPTLKTAFLFGVGENAAYVASHIAARSG